MKLHRTAIIACLLVVVFTSVTVAQAVLFSEDVQITYKDKKIKLNKSFKAAANQGAKLVITNGAGWSNVKSLKIKINGTKLVTKKQVNVNVSNYSTNLKLASNNSISIVARKKGTVGRVKIQIVATDDGGGGGGDDGGGDDGGGDDGGGGGKDEPVFKRVAGYGDSILAGFIDGTLIDRYQVYNFGSQLCESANAQFSVPLISDPGIPTLLVVLEDGSPKLLPNTAPGTRIDPNAKLNNFSIPGSTVGASLLVERLGGDLDPFTLILGGNQTLMEAVRGKNPSLVILWIGSNDVLDMVLGADPSKHTKLSDFKSYYKAMIQELVRKEETRVIAANIPDLTSMAILLRKSDLPTQYSLWGLPDDVRLLATALVEKFIIGRDLFPNFDEKDYLTPDQVNQIRATIEDFNKEIERQCKREGVPLIDMYSISQQWDSNGITVAGDRLTSRWKGGLFGLDGIHPTFTAHALIANEFIEVINKEFGTNVAKVNVADVYYADPNQSGGGAPYKTGTAADFENFDFSGVELLRNNIRLIRERTEIIKERRARATR